MKRLILFLLILSTLNMVNAQTEKRITILHTNDLHSRLMGDAPEASYTPLTINDDYTTGGFARIAAIIKAEKETNEGITLVVDAGDFLMGTLFHGLEVETGFQLRLMKKMGYDITTLGNHEFDFGPLTLAKLIENSAKGGEIPVFLSGNAVFDKKDAGDDGLEELFGKGVLTSKYIVTDQGVKIGFFSLVGKNADNVAPKASPVTFSKQLAYAKKMVKQLEGEGCDLIICISHSGLSRKPDGSWGGEDFDLATKVKGLDLIISGHTHSQLDKPLISNGIPIIQAGEYGKFVGKISLLLSDGKIKIDDYKLIPVDDSIAGDESIEKLIEKQKLKISAEILAPLGMAYDDPVIESDFLLHGNENGNFMESNLGPLVADAIQYYVNSRSSEGTDLSMVAAGVIRDKIVPGIQSVPDIFRVMSLGSGSDNVPGYPLSRLYVTGKELKSILEILQVAYKSSPDNFCYYSGFRAEFDPDKGLLRKISKIEIVHNDGSVQNVDFSRKNKTLYSITANSYMLEFIGIIKKMSFGLINVVPKDSQGNQVFDMKSAVIDINEAKEGVQEGKEWLALLDFFKSMRDTNRNSIPDMDQKYSVPVKSFNVVKAK